MVGNFVKFFQKYKLISFSNLKRVLESKRVLNSQSGEQIEEIEPLLEEDSATTKFQDQKGVKQPAEPPIDLGIYSSIFRTTGPFAGMSVDNFNCSTKVELAREWQHRIRKK